MMLWLIGGAVLCLIAWFGWELYRAPVREDME
jgi:predicted negative regulator of RcsB-dependent stress response